MKGVVVFVLSTSIFALCLTVRAEPIHFVKGAVCGGKRRTHLPNLITKRKCEDCEAPTCFNSSSFKCRFWDPSHKKCFAGEEVYLFEWEGITSIVQAPNGRECVGCNSLNLQQNAPQPFYKNLASSADCQLLCQARDNICEHFRFNTTSHECFLLGLDVWVQGSDESQGLLPEDDVISGSRTGDARQFTCSGCVGCEVHADYFGNDLNADDAMRTQTARECQSACAGSPDVCKAFTWLHHSRRCYLKSTAADGMRHQPYACAGTVVSDDDEDESDKGGDSDGFEGDS